MRISSRHAVKKITKFLTMTVSNKSKILNKEYINAETGLPKNGSKLWVAILT